MNDDLKSLYAALTGETAYYHVPPSIFNRTGEAEGLLTGGNLAILAHLTGSKSEVDTAGKLLFIEDVGEYLYQVDRLLLNLKRAGKLTNLKGLIVGGFTDLQDTDRPFGATVEAIITDAVKEFSYPVCFNFPAGHTDVNFTLKMGGHHKLIVQDTGATLERTLI
jgi:muramoyltetrapeptide carboxypeptidase